MTNARDAEFAIVGAGPAGAWTAVRLARAGARVLLFDHSHPREKPCGGGLTGRALGLVAAAVPASGVAGVPVSNAVFQDSVGERADVPLDDHGVHADSSLVVVDRRSFDARLLDAAREAGAILVEDRVTDLAADAETTVIRTRTRTYHAAFVVGADGANSLVRRRLHRAFARGQLSIACGVYAHGVTSREIVVEFVRDPAGYVWSFPRADHLAIGVCAQADESDAVSLKAHVSRWVSRFDGARGATLVPYAWPIPSLSPADFREDTPAGDRWALIGDAAGLVDPITREGLFFALRSGDLLADACLGASAQPGSTYLASLRRDILPELEHAALLKRGFFRGPFTQLLVHALRESAPVNRIMANLVAGRQPYATLKRQLIGTFEVGLAWRLLGLEVRGRLGLGPRRAAG